MKYELYSVVLKTEDETVLEPLGPLAVIPRTGEIMDLWSSDKKPRRFLIVQVIYHFHEQDRNQTVFLIANEIKS